MPGPLAFHHLTTLDDAITLLGEHGDEAKVVAGATAFTILMRQTGHL